MTAQPKWLPDLTRNRKKAQGPKRTHRDELALWTREEDAALNSMIDGVPLPQTMTVTITGEGTGANSDVMLWPQQVSCNVAHMNADGSPAPCPGYPDPPLRTLVRDDDPATSVEAALSVKASNNFLLQCIRGEVERADGPLDAFEISLLVLKHHPTKWALDTIRTAVSRARQAGLIRVADELGSRGSGKKKRRVRRYTVGDNA